MIININRFNIARLHLTINENDTYVHYYCPRLTECLGKCDRRWIDSCTANSDISSLEIKKKCRKKSHTVRTVSKYNITFCWKHSHVSIEQWVIKLDSLFELVI